MSRFDRLLARLQRFYGRLPQPPRDPFVFFVWEVLSGATTAARRDIALGALRRLRALTPDAVARAPQGKLLEAVALAGAPAEQRVEMLRAGAQAFRRSDVLRTLALRPLMPARRSLRALPGFDAAAARRLLLFTTGRGPVPPDPRVIRVGQRLGFGGNSGVARRDAREVQQTLTRMFVSQVEDCRQAFLYLAHHGEATCTQLDPHCTVCPVLEDCPEGQARLHRRRN
jgi:endonuclease-3